MKDVPLMSAIDPFVVITMWTKIFSLLCFLFVQRDHAQVITGVQRSSACTGSLTISHFDTEEVLHKITKTVTDIIITKRTKVVVKQTGNCCHRVFTKRNCRGESVRVRNNEGSQIKGRQHRGSLSVVRFDANDTDDSDCGSVSDGYLRKLCRAVVQNEEEQARLTIEEQNVDIIPGEVYNVTVENDNTVIIIQDEKVVDENKADLKNDTLLMDEKVGEKIVNDNTVIIIQDGEIIIQDSKIVTDSDSEGYGDSGSSGTMQSCFILVLQFLLVMNL